MRSVLRAGAVFVVAAFVGMLLPGPAAHAAPHFVPINGAGSTWSEIAIHQWASNVEQFNIKVNYNGQGSTYGRTAFAQASVEFGVSEIPYGLTDSNTGRAADGPPSRPFAYMPIVAGGTAFLYNLKIGTQQVTNLRLSGDVLTKIFTSQITMWNDPAIKTDNPALNLPARKIVPVVRSDGSGTTAQFTAWMANQYPDIWSAFCRSVGRQTSPCGLTSYFPTVSGKNVGQGDSKSVASYVKSPDHEGTIGYAEWAYAIQAGLPVAKVRNKKDFYVEPTPRSVAVALTFAQIDQTPGVNYLTQKLDGVYNSTDDRTYPLSSYSYMIVPTSTDSGFTTDKGYTLSSFAYYFLCQGQNQVETLGYSPLPKNLVEAGYAQVARVPGSEQKRLDSGCNNPTFSSDGTNTLATTAPHPQACDHAGTTQCVTGTAGNTTNAPGGTGTGTANNPAGTSNGPGASTSAAPSHAVDPDTGELIGDTHAQNGVDRAAGIPVSLDGDGGWGVRHTLMGVAAALLAGLVALPPLVARGLSKKDER